MKKNNSAKNQNTTPVSPSPDSGEGQGRGIDGSADQVRILEESWKRALADYQNLLKRVESDKKDFIRFATLNLIAKFLPSLDILVLAAKHSQDAGVNMAVKHLQDVLSSEGLQEINPAVGTLFDHSLHDCIETLAGLPDNTIAETLTTGYKLGDFVLRPAKVKVFKSSQI